MKASRMKRSSVVTRSVRVGGVGQVFLSMQGLPLFACNNTEQLHTCLTYMLRLKILVKCRRGGPVLMGAVSGSSVVCHNDCSWRVDFPF